MTTQTTNFSVKPDVTAFFDPATNTISYVVKDPNSESCAVVDSVMDIDYFAGRITYEHADEIIAFIKDRGLKLEWIIETHVHADHLSAAPYIQEQLGGKIGVGENIKVDSRPLLLMRDPEQRLQAEIDPVRSDRPPEIRQFRE